MDNGSQPNPLAKSGFCPVPLHSASADSPLRLCLLARLQPDPTAGRFLLLRELPAARVYLGCICDAALRVHEWLQIWVQALEIRELAFSGYEERLTNYAFDERWAAEQKLALQRAPNAVVMTGMEAVNPAPLLIRELPGPGGYATVQLSPWRLCRDDALLEQHGLPRYSTSPHRYLHDPAAQATKTFIPVSEDAPTNAHVLGPEKLKEIAGPAEVFNLHAGFIRAVKLPPLTADEYIQVLEGRPWEPTIPGTHKLSGVQRRLQEWSTTQKGMPFLLHGTRKPADRLNEILLLKLAAWRGMFQEVRAYVAANQLPLLNLSPASFGFYLEETGDQFPALWTARCSLVKPGQAYPLKIPTTEQRYFLRLGRIEPSPFLPEGLGAHSLGVGSVRLRNVLTETDGAVLEGTLVAEDYLGLAANDLLWFKLPLPEQRLEFYAHVYTSEAVGPKEARFRTVPARLPEAVVASLKKSLTTFSKAPYEIWPLLSSPCDMHSLGIIGARLLLANSATNFAAVVDDILGVSRYLGKDPSWSDKLPAVIRTFMEKEKRLVDLISPRSLMEQPALGDEAWNFIHRDLWLETVAFLVRLFPGSGPHSFCKDFGDVSPLVLESVFEQPLRELDNLVLRLRSVLAPTFGENQEVAQAIAKELSLLET